MSNEYTTRELEDAYGVDGSTVPRVITAEELREGQWVAFKPRLGDDWDSGYVEEGPFIVGTVGWTVNFAPDDALTIVLLEDAPAEDSPKRLTGKTWTPRLRGAMSRMTGASRCTART